MRRHCKISSRCFWIYIFKVKRSAKIAKQYCGLLSPKFWDFPRMLVLWSSSHRFLCMTLRAEVITLALPVVPSLAPFSVWDATLSVTINNSYAGYASVIKHSNGNKSPIEFDWSSQRTKPPWLVGRLEWCLRCCSRTPEGKIWDDPSRRISQWVLKTSSNYDWTNGHEPMGWFSHDGIPWFINARIRSPIYIGMSVAHFGTFHWSTFGGAPIWNNFAWTYDMYDIYKLYTMYLCIYVSMYLCIYVSMYLCIYVCMYVCMYVCINVM